jgi:hypothetical protein
LPPARRRAPSTPPPKLKALFAALTIASAGTFVMSPVIRTISDWQTARRLDSASLMPSL